MVKNSDISAKWDPVLEFRGWEETDSRIEVLTRTKSSPKSESKLAGIWLRVFTEVAVGIECVWIRIGLFVMQDRPGVGTQMILGKDTVK